MARKPEKWSQTRFDSEQSKLGVKPVESPNKRVAQDAPIAIVDPKEARKAPGTEFKLIDGQWWKKTGSHVGWTKSSAPK